MVNCPALVSCLAVGLLVTGCSKQPTERAATRSAPVGVGVREVAVTQTTPTPRPAPTPAPAPVLDPVARNAAAIDRVQRELDTMDLDTIAQQNREANRQQLATTRELLDAQTTQPIDPDRLTRLTQQLKQHQQAVQATSDKLNRYTELLGELDELRRERNASREAP